MGTTCAIYSVNYKEEMNENIENRFHNMLDYAISKYKEYSRQNRLDFAFHQLEREYKDF